ncbi:MAG: hypothetical protein ACFHVJ_03885 [Aestuariibacter sp.]
MTATQRAIVSAIVAFSFYFAWTWWVNSMASDDQMLVLRSALLQGSYSAAMTITFTSFLNWTLSKMKCHKHPQIAVLPPLAFQTTMVILLNVLNATPDLVATVAPSILLTGIYGFIYAKSLLKTPEYICKYKLEGYEKLLPAKADNSDL